jgi:GT2 family glycosyltransferase
MNGMNTRPKVGVVLINRNGYNLTEPCVQSLVRTKYPNLLIVIVDNGSEQKDLNLLEQLARKEPAVLIHALGYNSGFTKANNAGTRVCLEHQADFIWILNNDTEVREDAIDLSVRAFLEHHLDTKNTLVSSIITYFDNDNIWCNGLRDLALSNFPRSVDKGIPAAAVAQPGLVLKKAEYSVGCSMFFSADFVRAHGLMDEAFFIYFDDLDYSLNRNNVYIQQPLVRHKVSSTSGFKGSGRYTPFQSHLYAKNGIMFYFTRKKIPFYQKLIFLGFTLWVFALLYIRDFPTLRAYFRGIREGLAAKPGTRPQVQVVAA